MWTMWPSRTVRNIAKARVNGSPLASSRPVSAYSATTTSGSAVSCTRTASMLSYRRTAAPARKRARNSSRVVSVRAGWSPAGANGISMTTCGA